MAKDHRNFGLDVLRFAAILLVVLSHLELSADPTVKSVQRYFGFLGVELFFVLSGFLIGGIMLREFSRSISSRTLLTFWSRRWFRTLPAYFVFLSIHFLLIRSDQRDFVQFVTYLTFLQNFAWKMPLFFGESWSLAVEEWFYILFPLLILSLGLAVKNRTRLIMGCALAVLVLSVGLRLGFMDTFSDLDWKDGPRKIVVMRFDSLMVGVIGAYVFLVQRHLWMALRVPGVFLFLLLFSAITMVNFLHSPAYDSWAGFWILTLCPATFLSVFPLFYRWEKAGGMVADIIVNISMSSYSLYLCHKLVIRFTLSVFRRLPDIFQSTWISSPICLVLSVIAAWFSYKTIELNFLRMREWAFPVKPPEPKPHTP